MSWKLDKLNVLLKGLNFVFWSRGNHGPS